MKRNFTHQTQSSQKQNEDRVLSGAVTIVGAFFAGEKIMTTVMIREEPEGKTN